MCSRQYIYFFLSSSRFALVEYFSLDGSTGLLSVKRRLSTVHWSNFKKNIEEIGYNVLQENITNSSVAGSLGNGKKSPFLEREVNLPR